MTAIVANDTRSLTAQGPRPDHGRQEPEQTRSNRGVVHHVQSAPHRHPLPRLESPRTRERPARLPDRAGIHLNALIRFAGLAGIKVLQVWGSYSTTIGNICYDLPDACASAAEMGRRGAALLANVGKESPAKTKACAGGTDGAVAAGGEGTPAKSAASGLGLLPMYDSGTARRGVETIAQAMGSATQPPGIRGKNSLLYPHAHRRKERRGTASQSFSEGRLARLLKAMEQVGGWRELHRALRKARFRTRRPRAVGTKNGPSVVGRTGPGGRGRILRPPAKACANSTVRTRHSLPAMSATRA
jgi:hypothetical protein